MTSFIGESYSSDVTCYEIPGVHSTASNLLLPLVSVRFFKEKKPKRFQHESSCTWQCALGISKLFSLLETQGKLNHDQHLRFKEDGCPCSPVSIKNCSRRLSEFRMDLWKCEKEIFLLAMYSDYSTIRIYYLIFYGKRGDPCWRVAVEVIATAAITEADGRLG